MQSETSKKKKKSRKGKKNQRKNCDTTDWEKAVESSHKESLEGGPIEKKHDSQLFFTDLATAEVKGDESNLPIFLIS